MANFICLIAKQYIYCQRCVRLDLNVQGLLRKINYIRNIEKYIAIKNNKLHVHQAKWCMSITTGLSAGIEGINDFTSGYLHEIE